MTEAELPKGVSGEQEDVVPERVVRWELTPEEIGEMNEQQLRQVVMDHQLMLNRLREAINILVTANTTNSSVTRADIDVILDPEKHEEYSHLKNRETL